MDFSWLAPYASQLITGTVTLLGVGMTLFFTGRRARQDADLRFEHERKHRLLDHKRTVFVEWSRLVTAFWLNYRNLYVRAGTMLSDERRGELEARDDELRIELNAVESELRLIAPELTPLIRKKNRKYSEFKGLSLRMRQEVAQWLTTYWRDVIDIRMQMQKSLGIEVDRSEVHDWEQLNEAPMREDEQIKP